MADPTTLYLLRHGEIDRPTVAQFEDAVLTERGLEQVHSLVLAWPHPPPEMIYCSRLARSVETASICAAVFRKPIRAMQYLGEWAATEKDVPQETYKEWERRCWADFNYQNDEGESLHHATDRVVGALVKIAEQHRGRPVLVSGHAILFSLFEAYVRGEQATEASKNRIGFAYYAIVEYTREFRIVREFAP